MISIFHPAEKSIKVCHFYNPKYVGWKEGEPLDFTKRAAVGAIASTFALSERSIRGFGCFRKVVQKNDGVFAGLVLAFTTVEGSLQSFTLPETNIFVPENGWLEDERFVLGRLGPFWGAYMLVFGGVMCLQLWVVPFFLTLSGLGFQPTCGIWVGPEFETQRRQNKTTTPKNQYGWL